MTQYTVLISEMENGSIITSSRKFLIEDQYSSIEYIPLMLYVFQQEREFVERTKPDKYLIRLNNLDLSIHLLIHIKGEDVYNFLNNYREDFLINVVIDEVDYNVNPDVLNYPHLSKKPEKEPEFLTILRYVTYSSLVGLQGDNGKSIPCKLRELTENKIIDRFQNELIKRGYKIIKKEKEVEKIPLDGSSKVIYDGKDYKLTSNEND